MRLKARTCEREKGPRRCVRAAPAAERVLLGERLRGDVVFLARRWVKYRELPGTHRETRVFDLGLLRAAVERLEMFERSGV